MFCISIDGVEIDAFECIYSPAKRRGPTPGRPPSTTLNGKGGRPSQGSELKHGLTQTSTQTQPVNAEWQPASVAHQQLTAVLMSGGGSAGNFGAPDRQQSNIQQQLNFLQQQMQQQAQQMQQQAQQMQQQQALQINPPEVAREPDAQRRKVILEQHQQQGIPRTIMSHTHLLDRGDPDGSRLRAYYKLSVDEMFRLPCTPSDEEHSARMGQQIPGSHLAALSAARFAEMALGAIVHNEVGLAMELCNAVVHCLRESVQEPVDARVMYEVAKAYFLLGVFRAYRGDMARYFKYRRVGLTYLSKLEVCSLSC